MASEIILLIDVKKEEAGLIKGLISSFEIKVRSLEWERILECGDIFRDKPVCLVILQVDHSHGRQFRKLRWIRRHLLKPVPVLVMLPGEASMHTASYVKAGADDYCLLPLHQGRFAVRFLVLLECGQAMVHAAVPGHGDIDSGPPGDAEVWHRVVGFLREGLSFFTPGYQVSGKNTQPIFNRWERVENLGVGGDGVVWKVREIETGNVAVAKIPHNREMNISSLRAAAILKRLIHHPNVVHLIEVVKDEDRFVLIQEYVAGETLSHLLGAGVDALQKEDIFLQLLSVTAYAHHHSVMHRDIKPDNIIITPTGNLKLLDFGIAEDLVWQDGISTTEGTLDFMPPEQFAGKSSLATDVWALGIILYLLSVNRLPFCHDNRYFPMDISMEMNVTPPLDINPALSPDLNRIIMTCLEVSLEKRYASALALLEDLSRTFPRFGREGVFSE
ncbi:Serine/threonine protein kinase [Desulfocicer vacuolatum DSM 3385]|uniref:Serine/threonine protein kinase n=1 Tax=Desulfocicer vacuolatum DSM 3385 TaxID=1121400 RepID=A0A1W2E6P0_9BACT|nr:serine/threonine-protein kinase [Desulfocicer vacuolatum]SMD05217.1 Serine/threonine protein kinase [Desulfocicer vacuolatum DSM 3385]